MKHAFFSTGAMVLFTALSLGPAIAESPWPSLPANSTGTEQPAPSLNASVAPHWEYQNLGYDRHGVWRGRWVLVR
jgi:hypothetical protein